MLRVNSIVQYHQSPPLGQFRPPQRRPFGRVRWKIRHT
jgi:hypothetical protein